MRKRNLRLILALFFVLFALADITFAGSCCGEEENAGDQNEATCFCCCSHVTVENHFNFAFEYFTSAMASANVKKIGISQPFIIYHPPKIA
jgi:hypothetical protein